jgi:vancomycin permeability regulator SanA
MIAHNLNYIAHNSKSFAHNLTWLALMLSWLCGCSGARDLFRPYAPRAVDVQQLLLEQAPLAHYDAALILGCPAAPDGSASPCERCRVKSAVRQYRRGTVGKLIFSGGAAHSPAVEADVMGDLAVARGVPAGDVLREGRALTTWQNLRFSTAILRVQHLSTVLIISTADHLPRARRIARFWGLDDQTTRYFACDRDMPPDSDAAMGQ